MIHFVKKRKDMISRLKRMGIRDVKVLRAMASVPREKFLSAGLEFQAYEEKALPIGFGQTISHPYTVAKMTEELIVQPGDKILEIGTGSGYQAAVLCEMGAKLFSVEMEPELYKLAKMKLKELGYSLVSKNDDGSIGWKAYAPYSAIIVTAGVNIVPDDFFKQLIDGGRLIIPVGTREKQSLILYTKESERITEKKINDFCFVPMTGKKGWKNDEREYQA